MYNGIKRKRNYKATFKLPRECKMLQETETIVNDIITKQYVIKTKKFECDPNISYLDFEISNLQAAGINVNAMNSIRMSPSKDKLMQNAETANRNIEDYLYIKSIAKEEQPTKQPEQ